MSLENFNLFNEANAIVEEITSERPLSPVHPLSSPQNEGRMAEIGYQYKLGKIEPVRKSEVISNAVTLMTASIPTAVLVSGIYSHNLAQAAAAGVALALIHGVYKVFRG